VAHPGCHDLPLGGNMAGVYRWPLTSN
jgi:hypothetical protein